MLRALCERDIVPDTIIGTSIGALNGAVIAADPTSAAVEKLTELWTTIDRAGVLNGSLFSQVKTLMRSKTHLHENSTFRDLVADTLGVANFEDLVVPFECVAASIERATARYFSEGPLVDAVLASSAVPGLLPPVEIDGEHFLDGGLVASIPLDRAVKRGASTVYVLQVGRVEEELTPPSRPWEVALVAFEISRRHRFAEAMDNLPENVEVHVLPTGDSKSFKDLSQYRGGQSDRAARRIDCSYAASAAYLDDVDSSK